MGHFLRLGVWGCGGHALNHLAHMPSTDLVRVTAVHDLDTSAMQRAASVLKDNSIFLCRELDVMLPCVDAVFIATPDHCHAEGIATMLRQGKHVLAEKPLAVNSEQLNVVRECQWLAERSNLVFLTCHPRRFDLRNEWMRHHLAALEGRYGDVTAFTFTFDYPAPKDLWKEKRGLLLDHVNHEVDLMSYILGQQPISAVRLFDTPLAYEVIGRREGDGVFFRFAGKRTSEVANWDDARETLALHFRGGRVEPFGRDPFVREYFATGELSREHSIPLKHNFDQYGQVIDDFARAVLHLRLPYVSLDEMMQNTEAGVLLTEFGFL